LNPGFDHDQLITWTLENQPLLTTPGSTTGYSNFGFSLLGRVIEASTGDDYESFMRSLLRRVGIANMYIAGDRRSDRRSNEVVYYPGSGSDSSGDPYDMPVERMDAHGGWVASAVDLARFCVANDRKPDKPDLLSVTALDTMLTGSTAIGAGLRAKGWLVNGGVWWHNGLFDGSASWLVKWNQYCWAVVANTREDGLVTALDNLPKKIL